MVYGKPQRCEDANISGKDYSSIERRWEEGNKKDDEISATLNNLI